MFCLAFTSEYRLELLDDSSPERSSTLVSDSGAATSPDALTDDETDTNDHNSKEAEDPQKPKKAKTPKVNIFKMFKFAGPGELALIFVAILCSIGHGVLNPLMSVWIGDIIDKFGATTVQSPFFLRHKFPMSPYYPLCFFLRVYVKFIDRTKPMLSHTTFTDFFTQ